MFVFDAIIEGYGRLRSHEFFYGTLNIYVTCTCSVYICIAFISMFLNAMNIIVEFRLRENIRIRPVERIFKVAGTTIMIKQPDENESYSPSHSGESVET